MHSANTPRGLDTAEIMVARRYVTPNFTFLDDESSLRPVTAGKISELKAIQKPIADFAPGETGLLCRTDGVSAKDQTLAQIPFKGAANQELVAELFRYLNTCGIPTHYLGTVDRQIMHVRMLDMLPVEFIVRERLAPSTTSTNMWRRYALGERVIDGIHLAEGLRPWDIIRQADGTVGPVVTLTTKPKDPTEHDRPILPEEAFDLGLITPEQFAEASQVMLAAFLNVKDFYQRVGLQPADLKGEGGFAPNGRFMIGDEFGPPDACRIVESGIDRRLAAGLEPVQLSKEPFRKGVDAELTRLGIDLKDSRAIDEAIRSGRFQVPEQLIVETAQVNIGLNERALSKTFRAYEGSRQSEIQRSVRRFMVGGLYY